MFGKRRRDKLFLRLIENQPTTVKHEESIDIEARKEKEVIDVAVFFLYIQRTEGFLRENNFVIVILKG